MAISSSRRSPCDRLAQGSPARSASPTASSSDQLRRVQLLQPVGVTPKAVAIAAPRLHRDPHVLERGQVGEHAEDLERSADPETGPPMHPHPGDVAVVEADFSAIRRDEPGEHVEERRLARAVRPDQAMELAGHHVQVDVVGGDERAEALVQSAHREDRRGGIELRRALVPRRDGGRAGRDAPAHQRPALPSEDALHEALDALGRAEREGHDDRREQQPPILGDRAQLVLQGQEGDRAPERAEELMHAAKHRHQQRVAGVLPAQIVGVSAAQQKREQSAGVAHEHRRDRERLKPEREGAVAKASHPLFVVAQRLQRAAERRMGDPPQQPHGKQHGGHGEPVQRAGVAQQRHRDVLQAVLAAGEIRPFVGDLEGDLRCGQGQQREIQPAPAQDEQPQPKPEQQRKEQRGGECRDLAANAAQQGDRDEIGGAAEEHRGAERHQPGVADQQVHRRAVQRVDRDLGDLAERQTEERCGEREPDQYHAEQQDRVQARPQPPHSKRSHRSPSRPRGRTSRTSAISTYIAAFEAAGANCTVSAVTIPTSNPAMIAPT